MKTLMTSTVANNYQSKTKGQNRGCKVIAV